MSYNADKCATLLSPPSGKKKRKVNFTLEVKGKKRKSTENLSVLSKAAHSESPKHHAANIIHHVEETSEQCASDFNLSSQIIDSGNPLLGNFEGLDDQKQHYETTIKSLNEKTNSLEIQVRNLETKLNQPMYEKVLASMKNVHFMQTLIKLSCSMCYMLRLLHWLGDVLIMPKTRRLDDLKIHEKNIGLILN